jgi:antitoxin CptB
MISAQQKAKLTWQCRRGMLELDLILQPFASKQLETLSDAQVSAFERLLNHTDPELYAWLMGYTLPLHEELIEIVHLVRTQHHV